MKLICGQSNHEYQNMWLESLKISYITNTLGFTGSKMFYMPKLAGPTNNLDRRRLASPKDERREPPQSLRLLLVHQQECHTAMQFFHPSMSKSTNISCPCDSRKNHRKLGKKPSKIAIFSGLPNSANNSHSRMPAKQIKCGCYF